MDAFDTFQEALNKQLVQAAEKLAEDLKDTEDPNLRAQVDLFDSTSNNVALEQSERAATEKQRDSEEKNRLEQYNRRIKAAQRAG